MREDRELLIAAVAKEDNWPINKDKTLQSICKIHATDRRNQRNEHITFRSTVTSQQGGDRRTNAK
jgi:hypothetical protein